MSNLTQYQPRNSDEQAIISARSNRIANMEQKDAYKQTLNVISSVFPMYGIDGDIAFYANIAKECALFAVDEIIKATTPLTSTYYWQEVEHEIENYEE